jgi:hypothetical protein
MRNLFGRIGAGARNLLGAAGRAVTRATGRRAASSGRARSTGS